MKPACRILVVVVLLISSLGLAAQTASREIAYSGYLTNAGGTALNGNYLMAFSLYNVQQGARRSGRNSRP
jgi:hypothetical protein